MKNAVSCDLRTLAPFMPSIIVTLVFAGTFMMIGCGSVGAAGGVSSMMTLLCAFSLAGYEDQNSWGRFRATLPLSRREIVAGRYATVLVLAFAGALLGTAVSLALQCLFAALPQAKSPELVAPAEVFASSLASMAFGLIACAIAIPFLTKFGASARRKGFRMRGGTRRVVCDCSWVEHGHERGCRGNAGLDRPEPRSVPCPSGHDFAAHIRCELCREPGDIREKRPIVSSVFF